MSKAPPWYKRNPSDWQRGTRKLGMSLELRGFYSECLDAMWELQGQLPKDAKALAMLLGANPRSVRALMPKLIALGKIVETEVGYYNDRMMADILGVDDVVQEGEFEPVSTSNGVSFDRVSTSNEASMEVETTSKVPKNPMITTRAVDKDIDTDSDNPMGSARARETESDRLHRQAYERGLATKGGSAAKSARAIVRAKGELDGSNGVCLEGGKLTVTNGSAADLAKDFPGLDLQAVCDRAAPDLSRLNYPTRDDAMAVLRKWARILSQEGNGRHKRSAQGVPDETRAQRMIRLCEEAGERMGLA